MARPSTPSQRADRARKAWKKRNAPDPLADAADEAERLAFIAHAATVKRDLLIRQARREGVPLRVIGARVNINKDTVARICARPEPDLHYRAKPRRNGL